MNEEFTINLVCGIVEQAKKDFLSWYGTTDEIKMNLFRNLLHDIRSEHFKRITNLTIDPEDIIKAWKKEAEEKIYEKVKERKKKE